ncbi:A24 family peptidase [Sphingomonas jatrophae]|uniref:Prepilin peptidase CpaA n=1 Tax=Sphingomonas jatrophae TaxID=1166337 RepID=A0A1I6JU42_9SPHN|nr:prepilin peptidase [Sphingomonas jatrophae]SFR82509.1 prepilin peptidase CpaA [Sphingomonas jatrophae]
MVATSIIGAGLVLLLGYAAWGDIRSREIPNWIVLVIALAAPLWWWADGLALWSEVGMRLLTALIVFLVFTGAWAIGMMGGGDVKLLAAIALWLAPLPLLDMLWLMAVVGGVLTIWMLVLHRWRRAEGRPEVPYGVAIAAAAAWVVTNQILTTPVA